MQERAPLPTAPSHEFRNKPLIERAGERFREAPLAPHARHWLKLAYHSALMLRSGGRGLACALPGGERVRVLPSHRSMSWNEAEYHAFRGAVTPGIVAFDIGANVGAYALLLGQWAGPRGRVFAFEPNPDVHEGLRRHVQMNHLSSTVQPILAAVTDTEGMAPLVVSSTAGESRLAGAADQTEIVVTAATTSIDGFCARAGVEPDFIKVDVEGWELSVLRGARETIRRRPHLALFVELHPSIWPAIGVTKDDLFAELDAQQLYIDAIGAGDVWSIEGVCVRLRHR